MADVIAIGGGFGSANSYGGYGFGVVERQSLQNYVLVVQDSAHGHSVDSVSVTQQHVLTVQNATHSNTADNVVVIQQHMLQVADAQHSTTSDSFWIIQNSTLAVSDTLHGLTSDNISIIQHHNLSVDNASHSLTFDVLNIIQQHTIVVNNSTHGLLIDGNLTVNQFLLLNKPDDAYHGLKIDPITIASNQVLIVDDSHHRFVIPEPNIVNWVALKKFFGNYKPGSDTFGSLTPVQIEELTNLYRILFKEYGSLESVETELGIHRIKYGEYGELLQAGLVTGGLNPSGLNNGLLEVANVPTGSIVLNTTVNGGELLSDKPLRILQFENLFAWMSEDGLFKIQEESGNTDKIDKVSEYGTLKQGTIEYGKL